jgi:ribosomal protein S18 acetylase RimI-like enzyme
MSGVLGGTGTSMRLDGRKATESAIPFLLSLRRETMGSHLAERGAGCSDDSHLARLLFRFDCAEVLANKGTPVGLLKLRRGPDAWEIVQIQLSRQIQSKGTGRAQLWAILTDAAIAGVAAKISVLKGNPAPNLYEKLGFKVVGEDADEYFMLHAA